MTLSPITISEVLALKMHPVVDRCSQHIEAKAISNSVTPRRLAKISGANKGAFIEIH